MLDFMIIDETFMWLYLMHKVGYTCIGFAVASGIASVALLLFGCMFGFQADLDINKLEIKAGKKMLSCLWFSVPALMFSLLVAGIAPSKDELKAYAAYRIGEKVVTSDEAQRLMNTALLYLEGKVESAKCGH